MVSNLVEVVSTAISEQMAHLSPELSLLPLYLPNKEELLHLPIKEDDSQTYQSSDTVRKEQQQHIEQLVAYKDESCSLQ